MRRHNLVDRELEGEIISDSISDSAASPRSLAAVLGALVLGAAIGAFAVWMFVWQDSNSNDEAGDAQPEELAAISGDPDTAPTTTTITSTIRSTGTTTSTIPIYTNNKYPGNELPPLIPAGPTDTSSPADATNSSSEDEPKERIIIDGLYHVGNDIVPGRYRALGTGQDCYYQVTEDASGGVQGIDISHLGDAFGRRIELKKNFYFETDGCGDWLLEDEEAEVRSADLATNITRDGVYHVGFDIKPGRYIAKGTGSLCFLQVARNASGSLQAVVRSHFGDAFGRRVDLDRGQFFETDGCGDWQLIDDDD